jgi:hypothetical protein
MLDSPLLFSKSSSPVYWHNWIQNNWYQRYTKLDSIRLKSNANVYQEEPRDLPEICWSCFFTKIEGARSRYCRYPHSHDVVKSPDEGQVRDHVRNVLGGRVFPLKDGTMKDERHGDRRRRYIPFRHVGSTVSWQSGGGGRVWIRPRQPRDSKDRPGA